LFFVKSIKTLHFNQPLICIEHEYKLGYCGHFSVSAITLSGKVAEIRSVHSFYRAMHYSAKRGIGIAIACRPSVCNVGGSGAHRIGNLKK